MFDTTCAELDTVPAGKVAVALRAYDAVATYDAVDAYDEESIPVAVLDVPTTDSCPAEFIERLDVVSPSVFIIEIEGPFTGSKTIEGMLINYIDLINILADGLALGVPITAGGVIEMLDVVPVNCAVMADPDAMNKVASDINSCVMLLVVIVKLE